MIHPPVSMNFRANKSTGNIIILAGKPHTIKDKEIINLCDVLIGCPPTREEIEISGTWKNIRFAEKINKNIMIFLPESNSFL